MSRSTTSTRRPAPTSKCSTLTVRWRRMAKAALVGFGGLAAAGLRQTDRRLAHSLRATQRIGTPWGLLWGPGVTRHRVFETNQLDKATPWRRGRDSNPR